MQEEQQFISQLESALVESQKQLDAAQQERLRISRVEQMWLQDVNSLKSIITWRKERLQQSQCAERIEGVLSVIHASSDVSHRQEIKSVYETPSTSTEEEINRVEWIFERVAESGITGILPTEIFEASQKAGVAMHPNYPYVALGKLIERGRIEKIGKRYRAVKKEDSTLQD